MKKVLSQEEIDTLISAMSSGEIEHHEVIVEKPKSRPKVYDFRRPNKFSKDHINSIENIYENYSRITANILSTYLRTNIDMKVASVEQLSFGDFIHSVPKRTILAVFKMEPLRGPVIMEAGTSLGFQFINFLCGAIDEDSSEERTFTEIEMSLLEDVFSIIIDGNATVWKDLIEISPKLEKIETNPQLNQTLSFSESIVLVTLKITFDNYSTMMNLVIPYRALDPVMDKLHSINYSVLDNSNGEDVFKKEIEESIADSHLEVDVLLGKTSITIDDFLDLQAGDVLALSNSVEDSLEMYIENNLYFYAQPGIYSKKLSVQIVGDARREVI